jgi:hypothetical protein
VALRCCPTGVFRVPILEQERTLCERAITSHFGPTTDIRLVRVDVLHLPRERAMERFDLDPARIMGDSAYGSADMFGWLVYEHGIQPYVTVFNKSARNDGTFSRDDFAYGHAAVLGIIT